MSSLISLPGSECCLTPALWLGGATQGQPGPYVCETLDQRIDVGIAVQGATALGASARCLPARSGN
jgi:hypothetical protein